jgi:hypothetical protein
MEKWYGEAKPDDCFQVGAVDILGICNGEHQDCPEEVVNNVRHAVCKVSITRWPARLLTAKTRPWQVVVWPGSSHVHHQYHHNITQAVRQCMWQNMHSQFSCYRDLVIGDHDGQGSTSALATLQCITSRGS